LKCTDNSLKNKLKDDRHIYYIFLNVHNKTSLCNFVIAYGHQRLLEMINDSKSQR